jgi:uncharacterized protein YbjT (DUF2867 family)
LLVSIVIGGTGFIGSKVVAKLGEDGHEAVAASLSTGVNTLTGEGLADALAGTDVLIDVSSVQGLAEAALLEFFETSTRNLLAAAAPSVGHYVALSVVDCDRLPDSSYLSAKVAQANLIANSDVPYSMVYATEVFEYIAGIADSATVGGVVRIAPVRFQPVALDDVVTVITRTAVGSPLNGRIEIAGPEQYRMDEFFRTALAARNDPREVITDKHARYFGTELSEQSLVPLGEAILGETSYREWLVAH